MFNQYEFIGTQRSGSNLLRVMLNQIEEITAPHPPHLLKIFYPLLPSYKNLEKKDNFIRLIEDVCLWVENNPVLWEGVSFNRKKILTQCDSMRLIEIFRVIYETIAHSQKAAYWCCKSMFNMNYFKELETLNVKPFYIYLLRDGRDVALSFKKAPVGEKHIYALAKQWEKDQKTADEICNQLPKNRFIKIHYEDILENAQNVMKQLCLSLKVPFQDKYINYHNSLEAKNTSTAGKMWGNLTKPVLKNNYNKYKKFLSQEEIKIFETIAGKELKKFGYTLENKESHLNKTYCPEEVKEFNRLNIKLKKEIVTKTSSHDLNKKAWQKEFLKKLQS